MERRGVRSSSAVKRHLLHPRAAHHSGRDACTGQPQQSSVQVSSEAHSMQCQGHIGRGHMLQACMQEPEGPYAMALG